MADMNKRIYFKLNDDHLKIIQEAAKEAALPVSSYIRMVVLKAIKEG